jgi:serine kinase of HPr protein (carbohydrate metabolism regulator)
MKLSEFFDKAQLNVITDKDFEDRDVTGCYIGDLLSWVMGRARCGNIWITIMDNINIVAVAELTDCSCIVLAENVNADASVVDKANSQGVVIARTEKTSYELAAIISDII